MSVLNRVGESYEEILDWLKKHQTFQIRLNTLGEGMFFFSVDGEIQRMVLTAPLWIKATNTEENRLHELLARDMVLIEEKRGHKWIPVHHPKAKSFQKSS